MSEITSHPRVRSVRNIAPQQASNSSWQIAAGSIVPLAALLGAAAVAAFREVLKSAPARDTSTLEPIPIIRAKTLHLDQRLEQDVKQHSLSATDSIKVAALAKLTAAPLTVQPAVLQNAVNTLLQAQTIVQARAAAVEMQMQAEQSHHQAVMQALAAACSHAAVKTGFGTVETSTGPQGMLRVVATDDHNHSLVTEITSDKEGYPALETEVVGVADGSCHNILDAFDLALEAEGVRAQRPKRTFTGGVCQLDSAKLAEGNLRRTQLSAFRQQAPQQTRNRTRELNANRQKNTRR